LKAYSFQYIKYQTMKIQLSTDKTIHGNESLHAHFTSFIATELDQLKN